MVDLLGGQVQVMFDNMPESIEYIRAGKLRPLAVTTAMRSGALPDVPTVSDFLPGFEASFWHGIGVPRNTPAEIINKSSDGMLQAMKDPGLVEKMKLVGAVASPKSPEQFRSFMEADYDKWRRVIKENGISLDNK